MFVTYYIVVFVQNVPVAGNVERYFGFATVLKGCQEDDLNMVNVFFFVFFYLFLPRVVDLEI